jgi:FkbM family methyltransferase
MLISSRAEQMALAVVRFAANQIGFGGPEFQVRYQGSKDGKTLFSVKCRSALGTQLSQDNRRHIYVRRHSTDLATFALVFINEEYSLSRFPRWPDISSWYDSIKSSHVPLIIDLGGNAGYATRYFRSIYPESFCVCVEPDEENHRIALLNNKEDLQVEVLRAAVSATSGEVRLLNLTGRKDAILAVRAAKGDGEVSAITVNSLIERYSGKDGYKPFLIKVDIEGSEYDLFSANTEWIKAFPIMTVELHDGIMPQKAYSQTFLRAIANLNRDLIISNGHLISLINEPVL